MSIKQVREFHQAFGLPVRDLPTVGTPVERALRVRLMLEEVLEFADAAGIKIESRVEHGDYIDSIVELEIFAPDVAPEYDRANLAAMLHELADVQYVVSGTAVQLGLPLQIAVTEVHAANMRKLGPDGKSIVDDRGKVQKPAGWRGADMIEVLDAFTPDSRTLAMINADLEAVVTRRTPSPCLDPEKMNGYADQFPGSDEGSQYDDVITDRDEYK